ncbi:MAG: menaquinone biosynthesis protein [Gemmatales bacterium]
MSRRIRIGAVTYLNTKPLIYQLEQLAPDADVILDLPSRLADQLSAGQLDVGLIPIVEVFRGNGYRIVPNMAIASSGPVLSVTVFSKVPWQQMRTLALDEGSRTSAALVQVLLRKRYGRSVETRPFLMNQPAEECDADAVLLIGDRAMKAALPGYPYSYDLGQEWTEWTGLPFVFAVWAVRPGVDLGPAAEALLESKRRGMENVAEIAWNESQQLQLDPAFCRRYLTNIIKFDLGTREWEGLRRFHTLAAELGLAPQEVTFGDYRTSTELSTLAATR